MITKNITIIQSFPDLQEVFARNRDVEVDGKQLTLITPLFYRPFLEGPGSDEYELRGPAFENNNTLFKAALDAAGIRSDAEWDGAV